MGHTPLVELRSVGPERGARVMAKLEELKENFPQGVEYVIAYDNTVVIRASIKEVVVTATPEGPHAADPLSCVSSSAA